jgi:hypothetical protein
VTLFAILSRMAKDLSCEGGSRFRLKDSSSLRSSG